MKHEGCIMMGDSNQNNTKQWMVCLIFLKIANFFLDVYIWLYNVFPLYKLIIQYYEMLKFIPQFYSPLNSLLILDPEPCWNYSEQNVNNL